MCLFFLFFLLSSKHKLAVDWRKKKIPCPVLWLPAATGNFEGGMLPCMLPYMGACESFYSP